MRAPMASQGSNGSGRLADAMGLGCNDALSTLQGRWQPARFVTDMTGSGADPR